MGRSEFPLKKFSSFVAGLTSLKFTAVLLASFLLLIFWGVLAQAGAEASGSASSVAVDRFFDSYFIWILDVLPLPAFKGLAVLAALNVTLSLVFRMPRGLKNAGLWLMHAALLLLLVGGVVGSELKREYNGYSVVAAPDGMPSAEIRYFASDDSLGVSPVKIDGASWPYYVHFRGNVEMPGGKTVAMYRASYDPLHFVPYAFMALFLLGAALHAAVKARGGGRAKKALPLLALVLLALPVDSSAAGRTVSVRSALKAEAPVLVDGTVRPFDSFARGFLDDLSGRVTYKCREADACDGTFAARRVVGFVMHNPGTAGKLALFKVFRGDVLEALHLPPDGRYASYEDLAKVRNLLELYASRRDDHPVTAEMRRLYANLLRYDALVDGTAFSVVKDRSSLDAAAERRLAVEVYYHRANLALWGFLAAFMACLLASLNLLFKSKSLDAAANVLCVSASVALTALFLWRAYVAMRPPMSSLYEIVLLVALLLALFESGAFLFCRNRTYSLMVPVTLMVTLLLFFAKFVLEPGDTFLPIPVVLNSSVFLTVHVFTIALGFAGMILSGVVAHLALFRGTSALPSAECPKGSPLYSLLYSTLAFGAVFTVIGTLLGGVWADFAWGRFWGFDPKECGALFVILWAMLALHLRAGRLVSPRGFALLNAFNVIVTFLCWFGINLLGVGLHSYGFRGPSAVWLAAFVAADLVAIALVNRRA